MSVNLITIKIYEENAGSGHEKTNPIQTQFNPIQSQLKAKQTQNKPNSNPIWLLFFLVYSFVLCIICPKMSNSVKF